MSDYTSVFILIKNLFSNFSLLFRKLLLKHKVFQVLSLLLENRALMIQRRRTKRKKKRKKLQLKQKKLQIRKRNKLKKQQALVKKTQMNLIVNLTILLMLNHNSLVRDLEPPQMLVVIIQKFKKHLQKLLFH